MDGGGGVGMGADREWGEDDALSEGGEASSDTWRRGRLMALKTSSAMQMTGSRKQRGEGRSKTHQREGDARAGRGRKDDTRHWAFWPHTPVALVVVELQRRC